MSREDTVIRKVFPITFHHFYIKEKPSVTNRPTLADHSELPPACLFLRVPNPSSQGWVGVISLFKSQLRNGSSVETSFNSSR